MERVSLRGIHGVEGEDDQTACERQQPCMSEGERAQSSKDRFRFPSFGMRSRLFRSRALVSPESRQPSPTPLPRQASGRSRLTEKVNGVEVGTFPSRSVVRLPAPVSPRGSPPKLLLPRRDRGLPLCSLLSFSL